MIKIDEAEILKFYSELTKNVEMGGYYLNPDTEFTKALIKGLLINEKRYGYQSCPCRLADGIKEADIDIICPCDYRDADLNEYGNCYCGLYVSQQVANKLKTVDSIPERRPSIGERQKILNTVTSQKATTHLRYPVWRCKVCGYLTARDNPPDICPICKAKKDRFERFM
jgi:ferredoxin-thioredoxin reductase catalytic subunit/rubredoxin